MSIFVHIFLVGAAWLFYFYLFLQEGRFSRSRSSKVTYVGANRKRVCDFLLVRNSNLGPILHRFGATARFIYVLLIPPLFHPNFGGVPVAPDRPCRASTSAWALSYLAVKIFSKNSNPCDHGTVPKHYGRTDGRHLITALCVESRGKNG